MFRSAAVLLVALVIVLSVNAQTLKVLQVPFTFTAGSTIQTNTLNLEGNFQNPVQFTIATQGTPQTQLCVQANVAPYPGNLTYTCPSTSFASLNGSNSTTASSVSSSRKSVTMYETTNKLLLGAMDVISNTTANLFLTPGASTYYATLESTVNGQVILEYTVLVCPDGSFGQTCATTPAQFIGNSSTVVVGPSSWVYYTLPVNAFTGYVTVTINSNGTTNLYAYAQSGTLPTDTFHAQVFNSNSKNQLSFSILQPYISGSNWYLGVHNNGTSSSYNLTINLSSNTCNATTYGYNCNDLSSIPVVAFNSTSSPTYKKISTPQISNNLGLSFLTYNATLIPNDAQYFRFSVGPQSGVASLQAYARFNNIPSPAVYDFNGTMEYVSQFILSNPNYLGGQGGGVWYVGVVASQEFLAWVGSNCLSCKDSGTCICNGAVCNSVNEFEYPTSTNDSFGMCHCSSKDYDKSYNCSQNPDAFSPVYIVLIVIGGVIVIAVAIGVPLYCYVKSRKRSNYDTI